MDGVRKARLLLVSRRRISSGRNLNAATRSFRARCDWTMRARHVVAVMERMIYFRFLSKCGYIYMCKMFFVKKGDQEFGTAFAENTTVILYILPTYASSQL